MMAKKEEINMTITCPSCGKKIEVIVRMVGGRGFCGEAGTGTDRPDGGPRSESQQEYFGNG